jgi:hypothetical protein
MLFSISFPFTDTRGLIADAPPRLAMPSWPAPAQGQHVRSWGAIVPRKRGGLDGFGGEDFVCDFAKALSFRPFDLGAFAKLVPHVRMHVAFQRMWHQGVSGKFEIGISLNTRKRYDLSSAQTGDLVELILTTPVLVQVPATSSASRSWVSTPLARAGKPLATAYARLSSAHPNGGGDSAAERAPEFVVSGEPVTFLSGNRFRNRLELPGERRIRYLPDDDQGETMSESFAPLFHTWFDLDGLKVRTWLICAVASDHEAVRLARYLRIGLQRVHCERQSLLKVLTEVATHRVDPTPGTTEHATLDSYVDYGLSQFKKPRRGKIERHTLDLMDLVLSTEDRVTPGFSSQVLQERLRALRIRRNTTRNAIQFINKGVIVKNERGTSQVTVTDNSRQIGSIGGDYNENAQVDKRLTVGNDVHQGEGAPKAPGKARTRNGFWVRHRVTAIVLAVISAIGTVGAAYFGGKTTEKRATGSEAPSHP